MNPRTHIHGLLAATLLFGWCGATFAQELPGAVIDSSFSEAWNYPAQLSVRRPGLATAGIQAYVPPPKACICTNLGGVSVICEDCDRETTVDRCHLHDRACQDAAQQGGIREHRNFFCTTSAN